MRNLSSIFDENNFSSTNQTVMQSSAFESTTQGPEGMNRTEMSWFKASAGLDASAKIYGFRVDQVHSETYKVLGGLNRSDNR